MERFMAEYDPLEELAPRDVVARSIDDQLKRRNEKYVYLDISHKPREEILAHFPNIAAECLKYGLDITKDPIPVVPAAHYMCGGIQTGLSGETSINGLYAAGEVTCTGLHGANRLASNSLLEALVFAQRAVEPSIAYVKFMAGMQFNIDEASEWPRLQPCSTDDLKQQQILEFTRSQRKKLQQIMWEYVGIVRSTDRLKIAQSKLIELQLEWEDHLYHNGWNPSMVEVELCEMRNLVTVANLVVSSAMGRQESRGLHFTVDYPELVESERLPTMLFPSTPMTTTWSSQQVHTMSMEGLPLSLPVVPDAVVPDPIPLYPQKKIDR
jgi:L-aspartate oxidase